MHDITSSRHRAFDVTALVAALTFPTLITGIYFVLLADHPATIQQVSYSAGKVIQFLFPVVWVCGYQRRRLEWQGPRAAGLPMGIGFGLIVVIAMLALYHAYLKPAGYFDGPSKAVAQKVEGFGVDSFPKFVALGFFLSVPHSFLEEYYWRWFVFGQLRRHVSLLNAVAISSLGFMAHHVIVLEEYFGWQSPATWLFSLAVAVGGAVWAWLYHRSNSLYGPWLSHLVVDAGAFLIGYDMVFGIRTGAT